MCLRNESINHLRRSKHMRETQQTDQTQKGTRPAYVRTGTRGNAGKGFPWGMCNTGGREGGQPGGGRAWEERACTTSSTTSGAVLRVAASAEGTHTDFTLIYDTGFWCRRSL